MTNIQATIERIAARKPEHPSLGSRIRRFFDDLFTSRLVRALEIELINTRIDKNREIDWLRQQNALLQAKVEKLELAIWPQASRAGQAYVAQVNPPAKPKPAEIPLTQWQQVVKAQVEENARLDAEKSKGN